MKLTDSRTLVELWCGRVSSSEAGPLERHCEASLSEEERIHACRFRRPTTRNQHIVGRGMARTLLAAGCMPPQEIQFAFNPHGKPDVTSPPAAKRPFNIAHTEGLVLYAACDRGRIGVDVERLARNTDCAIARRYFAAPEVEFVMDQPNDDAMRLAFLKVWTLKESFVKAVGKGLAIPLADFAFEEIDSPSPRLRLLQSKWDDGCLWRFACLSPADGYIAAVAVSDVAGRAIDVQIRDFHTLLPSLAIGPGANP
ncbi:MAG: 4'-phosphopantetheinyl transferase family protein [Planctomycetaceae bacterium]